MEFWGVEVKPGETVKVDPGEERYVHISQASLGETKKGNECVPIFLRFNDKKLVIGTLSSDKCTQIPYDLVLEKEFELSHSSKNTSIYFCGYKTHAVDEDNEDLDNAYDLSDADLELAQPDQKVIGKPDVKDVQAKPAAEKPEARKPDTAAAKAKPKAVESKKDEKNKAQVNNDDEDESDEDDDEDGDMSDDNEDSDEEMNGAGDDSEGEDSDDDEEDTPKKVEPAKKRPTSASKTPVPEKKAKVVSPIAVSKSGDAGKKVVHIATPHPAKKVGKDKSKQQSPKSGGSVICKSCSKTFGSETALQSHSKAKHGEGK